MSDNDPSGWPSPGAVPAPPPGPSSGMTAPPPPFTPSTSPWSAPGDEHVTEVSLGAHVPARRGKGKIAAGIVGVGALIAAGAFAVSATQGGGDGGADTPEAAVQALVDAVNQEDVLGALDVVLPGERDTFRGPLVDLVEQLRRLEVLGETADLGDVGGVDVELVLTNVQVEQVADDIAVVDLSGTATGSINAALLPYGDLVLDRALDGEQPDEAATETTEFGGATGEPVRLATVERDGRWYVSLWYTVAELARQDFGATGTPPVDQAIVADGGDTPEQAMDQFLARVADLDLEGVIASLNPNEFEALQRYAPLFLGDAQQGLDDAVAESGLQLAITDVTYDTKVDGDTATVGIESLSVRAETFGESIAVDVADGCVTFAVDGEEQEICPSGDAAPSADAPPASDAGAPTDSGASVADAAAGVGVPGLTEGLRLDRVDDQWYVSPVGSVLDSLVGALEGIERTDLENVLDGLEDGSLDPFASLGITGFGMFGLGGFAEFPIEESESFGSEDPPASTPQDPSSECYMEQDVTAAVDCLVAAQQADPDVYVPAALLFPECGLAEIYWTGRWHELGDSEFLDTINTARGCFDEKIASGVMDEVDLPMEVADPSCYAGVNPYAIEDVEEANAALEAFYDCVFE